MKRWTWLLLLTALAAPGCLLMGPQNIEEPPVQAIDKKDLEPRPVVTPDQVNENNARDVLQQLHDEVERKRNEPLPGQR